VSRTDLAEANYLSAKARVLPGQRLVVPRAPSAALLASRGPSPAVEDSGATTSTSETRTARPARAEKAEPVRTVYRVRQGDTLYAIARRHGVSVDDLRKWNRLKGSALSIGDRLEILSARAANAQ
jgi:membrane-bound lytic murein transglycosylase D